MTMTSSVAEEDWSKRTRLTGDWDGARTALEEKGVDIIIQYIGEVLGVSGGPTPNKTHATYEGRLDVTVNTDLDRLLGWKGGKAQIRVFQIHDVNSRNAVYYTGSIADPSNIDALPTTRLFTAWVQQEIGTFASLRAGQLAADDEFLVAPTAGGLINGTFGWAAIAAANLRSGGPAYPLATPGLRLQLNPTETITVLGAVFSGDTAGANCYTTGAGDSQRCNRFGTTFSLVGGPLWIGEVQYNINQGPDSKELAGSYKLGIWYHAGQYVDLHYGIDSATRTVVSQTQAYDTDMLHNGNWGIYGVADQMVWRQGDASANLFVRAGMVPSDRNLVSWYIDGGFGLKGFVPGRAADTLTVGIAYSKISKDAIALDTDVYALDGIYPRRIAETVVEVSYIAQITPYWSVQPDFQYIVNPNGNVAIDGDPTNGLVDDVYVFGVRTTITF
ncbi:MAG: carbohydrate porin [Rhodopseudomonas sp.]|uniref:carbohydrate porin n=1 Tax=Rhodopseudomonas sp. TaxID=1078 RepID=UPI0039E2A338